MEGKKDMEGKYGLCFVHMNHGRRKGDTGLLVGADVIWEN